MDKDIKNTADEFYVAKFEADVNWGELMDEAREWYKQVYLNAKKREEEDKDYHKTKVISEEQINNLTDRHYNAKEWYGTEYAEVEPKEEVEDECMVHSPTHYSILSGQGIEAIDIINEISSRFVGNQAYYIGNVLKYLLRAGKKGGADKTTEDLRKARVYLDWCISHREV